MLINKHKKSLHKKSLHKKSLKHYIGGSGYLQVQ